VVVVPVIKVESFAFNNETVTYSTGLLVLLSINAAKTVAGPTLVLGLKVGCAKLFFNKIKSKKVKRSVFFNERFIFKKLVIEILF
jgi:hypothetical protein